MQIPLPHTYFTKMGTPMEIRRWVVLYTKTHQFSLPISFYRVHWKHKFEFGIQLFAWSLVYMSVKKKEDHWT